MNQLEAKIKDKKAVVGIVGMGYVGFPLAVAFAEAGFKVLGFDVQKTRAELINKGESYITAVYYYKSYI